MKKSMLILLLMFLMSSCEGAENPQKIGENPPVQTTLGSTTATTEITETTSDQTSVTRQKTTTQTNAVTDRENPMKCQIETESFEEETVEFPEIQPIMESQITVTVSENAEEKEFADFKELAQTTAGFPEIQPKTESHTTVTVSENAEQKEPVDSVTTTVQTEADVEEIPDIPQKTDYEKAWEIYRYMRENGSGTCVNYACRIYEMCQEVGLPCYIVWTENHCADTLQIPWKSAIYGTFWTLRAVIFSTTITASLRWWTLTEIMSQTAIF